MRYPIAARRAVRAGPSYPFLRRGVGVSNPPPPTPPEKNPSHQSHSLVEAVAEAPGACEQAEVPQEGDARGDPDAPRYQD